ncbi:hypothetical protein RUM43_004267 [Polyplax serrata]|uniref:Uncharacterized protein n=1 Tax=Polyplax serrata TaxID=468196 RepID=A0AAN8SAP8_POLSC
MSVSVLQFKDKIIPVRETERESNYAGEEEKEEFTYFVDFNQALKRHKRKYTTPTAETNALKKLQATTIVGKHSPGKETTHNDRNFEGFTPSGNDPFLAPANVTNPTANACHEAAGTKPMEKLKKFS